MVEEHVQCLAGVSDELCWDSGGSVRVVVDHVGPMACEYDLLDRLKAAVAAAAGLAEEEADHLTGIAEEEAAAADDAELGMGMTGLGEMELVVVVPVIGRA